MVTSYPPLIRALLAPGCYSHPVRRVSVLETHISWVLLAGRYAYKIKKPVNLGFLDFSQLEQRGHFCREEIRLNRRLAPQIYLEVSPIGGSLDFPRLDTMPALEYAVKMRRFAAGKLLDNLLLHDRLEPRHIDQLATTIAVFHQKLPAAAPDSEYGSPQAIQIPARQNFQQLAPVLDAPGQKILQDLQRSFEREFACRERRFIQRKQDGFIREGHGDLHLGNIFLYREKPVAFDGIEFSPELRWIDVINDAGFLIMDLMHRGHANLAYRFLNGYLQQTGDYAGLELLPFYLSYRAMVRAKIAGFRLAEEPSTAARRDCLDYLRLADESLKRRRPALIITHGLPGCGKSTVSQMLLEKHLLIRLRSDIERKRLFGLSALQQSGSRISGGIYNAQASERVYRHLLEQARTLLENGYAVIIDAAFLKHQQRQPFRHLAQQMNAAFAILTIQARDEILRQRIMDRQQRGDDPSEAGLTVLDHAICEQEALQTDELVDTRVLHNDFGEPGCADQQPAWRELARLIQ